jgi:phosphoribosylanthranilate isomerase
MTAAFTGCRLQSMAIYLRVKICGVTEVADAVQADILGADAIGLNFYKGSPRYITPARAEVIMQSLSPFVEPVGIFVSFDMRPDLKLVSKLRLRTIQLHEADENSTFIFLSNPLGIRLISAFSVSEKSDLDKIGHFMERCEQNASIRLAKSGHQQNEWKLPAAILLDARVPGQFGGTGKTAPWKLLADFGTRVPLILAGGLTPENVAEAVRIVRPYGVDVASGVESSPGHKDPEKMKRFIENAREAAEK